MVGKYKFCWPKQEPREAWRVKKYDNLIKSKNRLMIFSKENVEDFLTTQFFADI